MYYFKVKIQPRDTPRSAEVDIKFRRQVAVDQSV
jgi:hypothetical protein